MTKNKISGIFAIGCMLSAIPCFGATAIDLQSQIDAAASSGGGVVSVPPGDWTTRSVHLADNVELHLEEGARLIFPEDLEAFLPAVRTSWEGIECIGYSPLVYAYGCTNVAITGKGTLEAQVENRWRSWGHARKRNEKHDAAMKQLRDWSFTNTPIEERNFWSLNGSLMRPPLIQFNHCKDVRIDGIRIRQSPFWTIHLLCCENAVVRNVDSFADLKNSDGIDIESCKNVLVEDCTFEQGDDAIVIKSGINFEGRRRAMPSEDITIRRCTINEGHAMLSIGSELSGGIRNVLMEDCHAEKDINKIFFIKTNPERGGFVENITVRRIKAKGVRYEEVSAITDYFWKPGMKTLDGIERATPVKNILLEDIWCDSAKCVYSFRGYPTEPIRGLVLRNVQAGCVAKESSCEFVEDFKFEDNRAVHLLESEMSRMKVPCDIDKRKRPKWEYTDGLELQAALAVAGKYPQIRSRALAWAQEYIDRMITKDGVILGYRVEDCKLDCINTGKFLFDMYELALQRGDAAETARLKKALDLQYSQFAVQPRVAEGGFWHKRVYPHQMWLDGLYMGAPFYARYAAKFLQGDERNKAFDDIANQFAVVSRRTFDPSTGLYRHGWDEAREQIWADRQSGQSAHAWGRALGWFAAAIVDTLDYLPKEHSAYAALRKLLTGYSAALIRYQDPSGAWWQVADSPHRDGNYLEATATALIGYALMKAYNRGWLGNDARTAAQNALNALDRDFMRHDPDGSVSLTRCCSVAGLSNDRDGSFEYYLREKIRDNDAKGVGPYIFLVLESQKD